LSTWRHTIADAAPAFTPVNLLTGFLGSGKTTLLRRLLADPAWSDTAVLINEFGEVGLDHHLLERIDETTLLLQSGCLCCTVRGELAQALRGLYERRDRGAIPAFRRVVVESTGLADPFPVLSTLKGDNVLRHHFRAGTVVTTVDAVNGLSQLASHIESVRQAAIADRIILTKTDLVDENATGRVIERLRQINPDAPIACADETTAGTIELLQHLDGGASSHSAEAWFKDQFRNEDTTGAVSRRLRGHNRKTNDPSLHSDRIRSCTLILSQPIDWTSFGVWLTMLLHRHGDKVLRVKGILDIVGEESPVAIHGVQHLVHPPTHLAKWLGQDRRSRIVFIVDGLDPALLQRSLAAFSGLETGSNWRS
jgi:G3E family GTPase